METIKSCRKVLLVLLFFTSILIHNVYAQCDYVAPANVELNHSGASGGSVVKYFLVSNADSKVKYTSVTPTFTGVSSDRYTAYALVYAPGGVIPSNAVVGAVWSAASQECAIQKPLAIEVCATCDYSNKWSANHTGQNLDAGYTTKYALVKVETGIMEVIQDMPTFNAMTEAGYYQIWAINYKDSVSGLLIGQPISNVTAECIDKTAGQRFKKCITISGTVFNDANGITDQLINGIPTNTIGTNVLYANLVDGTTDEVVLSVPVNADGTYTLSTINGIEQNKIYQIVLSNGIQPIGSVPDTELVGGVNTSEAITPAYEDGLNDGRVTVSVGTTSVTGVNFGVNLLPTADTITAPGQTNPGGTTSVAVPPSTFGGTDSDGVIESLRIVDMPSNATSITVGTTTYYLTSGDIPGVCPTASCAVFPVTGILVPTNPSGEPTIPVLVDPIDGTTTVSISYVTIDNSGKESDNRGSANIPFEDLIISGSVFNDVNGITDQSINGTPTNTIGTNILYANLVDGTTNEVILSVAVNADGTYSFGTTDGVEQNKIYQIVLSNGIQPIGSVPNTTIAGGVNTSEAISPAYEDGLNDGRVTVSVGTTSITGVNFGVNLLPTAGSGENTLINPGDANQEIVPSNTFTNTSLSTDPLPGKVSSILITEFPDGATTIVINGTVYDSQNFPSAGVIVPTDSLGNPLQEITVDPTDEGYTIVTIPFKAIDAAGTESPNTGTAVVHFIGTPNLSPVISFLPATIVGTTNVGVVVDVYEFNDVATREPVFIYIPKDIKYTLNFNPSATTISGVPMQNSEWNFDNTSNSGYYILSTDSVIQNSGLKSFGFTTVVNPNSTVGSFRITAIILDMSGGELEKDNIDNMDDDRLYYSY